MNLDEILAEVEDTDELIIGPGKIEECGEIFRKYWDGKSALIVADTNTWKAAGEKTAGIFERSGIETLEPLIFEVPPLLHADYGNVEIILRRVKETTGSVPVSVGSGTINDLVKRAAHELNVRYLSIGTAASMDGYCSSGAALAKDGLKITMECRAPRVIIADTDILLTAPEKASAAGYGDLASKLTAGADWIIADFTGDEPIDKDTWNIIQPRMNGWLAEPERIKSGNPEAVSGIFEGLNFCGLAMQFLGRSRAASGAEHLFSHIWEMSGHLGADGNPVSHGFQVSVGILCSTALYEEVFRLKADDIDVETILNRYPSWDEKASEIETLMGEFPAWREYLDTCRPKHLSREELEKKLYLLKGGWEDLKARVWDRLPRYSELKETLKAAGCPVTPADINLPRETALKTYQKAQCMRNRYTILDLAYELGMLEEAVARIEKSGVYLC